MGTPPTFLLCSNQVTRQPLLEPVHQECKCCWKWMDHSRTGGSAYINLWAEAIKVTSGKTSTTHGDKTRRPSQLHLETYNGTSVYQMMDKRTSWLLFLRASVFWSVCNHRNVPMSSVEHPTPNIRRDSLAISGHAIWKTSFQEEVVRYR